jgi:YrbI family 3-deoxy-D-manno-octulosonate 8-phosphate phosphatase
MDSKKLNKLLKKVKLLVMDVDGTLTNGFVYYSKKGEELKQFSIRDGMGIELLRLGGIETAIVTSENSEIVTARAKKLKIKHVILGSRNKFQDLKNLAADVSLSVSEIAFIGDDVNDIRAMEIAGVSACPNDASNKVILVADYICGRNGGDGAVREFAELILKANNKNITLPENW